METDMELDMELDMDLDHGMCCDILALYCIRLVVLRLHW